MKDVRVRLGRSRSRPLGSTISRIVPLASGREAGRRAVRKKSPGRKKAGLGRKGTGGTGPKEPLLGEEKLN